MILKRFLRMTVVIEIFILKILTWFYVNVCPTETMYKLNKLIVKDLLSLEVEDNK